MNNQGNDNNKSEGVRKNDYCGICKKNFPGHEYYYCPMAVCSSCGDKGHQRKVCPLHARCYDCGETGHFFAMCPKNPRSGVKDVGKCCFECGEYGHLVAFCPNKENVSEVKISKVVSKAPEGAVKHNLEARGHKRPATKTVDDNVKKMIFHMQKFTNNVDMQGLNQRLEELNEQEKKLKEEFEERIKKIEDTRNKILEEKKKAAMIEQPLRKLWAACGELGNIMGFASSVPESPIEIGINLQGSGSIMEFPSLVPESPIEIGTNLQGSPVVTGNSESPGTGSSRSVVASETPVVTGISGGSLVSLELPVVTGTAVSESPVITGISVDDLMDFGEVKEEDAANK